MIKIVGTIICGECGGSMSDHREGCYTGGIITNIKSGVQTNVGLKATFDAVVLGPDGKVKERKKDA